MHRIERDELSPFNRWESRHEDHDENMVEEVKIAGLVIAWVLVVGAFVWLLSLLIHAGLRFEHWKWMVQR